MRLLWITLVLALLVLVPFFVLGGRFDAWLGFEAAAGWMRERGAVGVLLVFAALASDVVLPVPSTPIMSAAGFVHGAIAGGALAAAGSFASGMIAYFLGRRIGSVAAEKLVGARDLDRSQALFDSHGAWIVACSRAVPVLQEVSAVLAGHTRMPARRFVPALLAGAVTTGFGYAAIGAAGREAPWFALVATVFVPGALLLASSALKRGGAR